MVALTKCWLPQECCAVAQTWSVISCLVAGNAPPRVQAQGFKAEGMHGDLDQHTRMSILSSFKEGKLHVLVATDVAARGLDIRSIRTVVNYDVARSIDTHVHRIGRTGRAGSRDGCAYTLLMPKESRMAAALVENLRSVGQSVPKCDALLHCCALPQRGVKPLVLVVWRSSRGLTTSSLRTDTST